jgi:hypothetical protein
MICLSSCFCFTGAFAMFSALLSCCDSENKNAFAPNRGEGMKALAVPPFSSRPSRLLPDTSVGCVVNGSTYMLYASSSSPCLLWSRPTSSTETMDLNSPLTRENGSDYSFHRNGSKASSSSVLTGSHHPPALWKARNDYYSSSQPLYIFAILEKSNR